MGNVIENDQKVDGPTEKNRSKLSTNQGEVSVRQFHSLAQG